MKNQLTQASRGCILGAALLLVVVSNTTLFAQCEVSTSSITVAGNSTVCSPATVSLLISDAQDDVLYWLVKNGVDLETTTAKYRTGTSVSWTVSSSGSYSARARKTGCSTFYDMSGSATATIAEPGNLTITPNAPAPVCQGAPTVTLTANGATGGYTWSSNDATIDGPTNMVSVTPGATGHYRVTANVAGCGSVTTDYVFVEYLAALAAGTISGNQTVCAGTSPSTLASTGAAAGSSGSYSYQWQSRPLAGSWSDISGATGLSYSPTAVSASTEFRRKVSTSYCADAAYTNVVTVTVYAAVSPGTISSGQTVCSGGTVSFSSLGAASGGNGSITYQWQSSVDNSTWIDVSGATSLSYTTGTITSATYFRRKATSCGGASYTNTGLADVFPNATGGVISAAQSICPGTTPAALVNTTPAGGGDGAYVYQWQNSSDNSTWFDIPSANTDSYAPGALSSTTYYRRKVTSCSSIAFSPSVSIVVFASVQAGTIGPAQAICYNSVPSTLTAVNPPSAGSGTYTYQWQNSTNNTVWSDIAGATGATYAPSAMTSSSYFRRKVTSCGVSAFTPSIFVTVYPLLASGSIGGGQTICVGSTPTALPSLFLPTGGTGTYTYQWQQSPNTTTWSNASGVSNQASYSPPAVTTTTYYRRTVTSCGTTATGAVQVAVSPTTVGGNVSSVEAYGISTGSIAVSGQVGVIVQWESKVGAGAWTSIGGTSPTLSYSNVSTTTNYRAQVKSGACAAAYSSTGTVTIYAIPSIAIQSRTAIAPGDSTQLTTTAGLFSYIWYKDGSVITNSGPQPNSLKVKKPGTYKVAVKQISTSPTYTTGDAVISSSVINQFSDMNYVMNTTFNIPGVTTSTDLFDLKAKDISQVVGYFDGLGRPVQTVAVGSSPSGGDVIQPTAYDPFGREPKKFLPYATSARDGRYQPTALADQLTFYNGTSKVASDPNPFSLTNFEASPLSRAKQDYGPGIAWQTNAKYVQHTYLNNVHGTAAGQEKVISWIVNGSGMPVRQSPVANYVVTGGYYASGQLVVKSTKDEQGNEVREYSDKEGHTVLKKVQAVAGSTNLNSVTEWALTYYVYDDFGSLRFVFQPELSKTLHANDTNVPDATALANFGFQYQYDSRLRMITKQVPGAAAVYMVYDNRNRLVLTQDGNQRASNKWTFTKYDTLNRPVMTGLYTHGSSVTQTAMSALVSTTKFAEAVNTTLTHGYTTNVFPTTNLDVLTVTYYDSYSYIQSNWGASFNYANDGLTVGSYSQPTTAFARVTGVVTGTKVKVLDGGTTYLRTISYYDDRMRGIQSIADNARSGIDRVSTLYDFAGKVLTTKRIHMLGASQKTVVESFQYDNSGRVVKALHSMNGGASVVQYANEYNALGQLVDKKLHSDNGGTNYKQSIDLRYNIRGWLVRMNNSDLSTTSNLAEDDASVQTDLFGFELGYESALGSGNTGLYNGNISGMKWSKYLSLDPDNREVAYNYSYDALNRITAASYLSNGSGTWANATGAFNESGYSYDLNGNIMGLTRKDAMGVSMDVLAYDYGAVSSNQLLKVSDTGTKTKGFVEPASTTGNDYTYDANGSMTTDKNKDITAIVYNYLNLPERVTKSSGDYIKYIYTSTGGKLRQEVYNASNVLRKKTDYSGEYVYENDTLKFANTAEGRVVLTGATPEYQYHLKDHLGNVRMTFTSKSETVTYTAGFETADATTESATFSPSYSNAVIINGGVYNHTVGGSRSQRLTAAAQTDIIGLSKSLKVLPGDVINAEVYAKYLSPTTTNTSVPAQLLTAITSSFGVTAASTGEAGLLYQSLSTLNSANLLLTAGPGVDENVPKAYLNYILFDENFIPYDFGFDQVSANALNAHEKLMLTALARKPGYLYIYLSNENGKVVEVYFDDLKVEHVRSAVIQSQDYYPFGLTHNSYQLENSLANQYQFNGKEKQDELNLGWLDYAARMYLPDIGRWNALDFLAHKYEIVTPYSYAFSNPIIFIDPNGMENLIYLVNAGDLTRNEMKNTEKMVNKFFAAMGLETRAVVFNETKNGPLNEKKLDKTDNWAVIGLNKRIIAEKAASISGDSDFDNRVEGWAKRDGQGEPEVSDPKMGMVIDYDDTFAGRPEQFPETGAIFVMHAAGHASKTIQKLRGRDQESGHLDQGVMMNGNNLAMSYRRNHGPAAILEKNPNPGTLGNETYVKGMMERYGTKKSVDNYSSKK